MATLNVKLRVHRSGVRRMTGAPFMVREVERRAENVRLLAVQISPVRTGTYRASHTVRSGVNTTGAAFARVANGARDLQTGYVYAVALELGTSKMRAQRILRRALRAAAD